MAFFEWVRTNSQRYLMETSEREMAKRYLGNAPPEEGGGPEAFFWRRIFVPAYRAVPWRWRRSIMGLMPGSHRRHWSYRPDWKGPDLKGPGWKGRAPPGANST